MADNGFAPLDPTSPQFQRTPDAGPVSFLDFFKNQAQAAPPAKPPQDFAQGLPMTAKGAQSFSQQRRAQIKRQLSTANPRLGTAWQGVDAAEKSGKADAQTADLARSWIFMTMKDAQGNEVQWDTGSGDVQENFKPTVTAGQALAYAKAHPQEVAAQRDLWRRKRATGQAPEPAQGGIGQPKPETPVQAERSTELKLQDAWDRSGGNVTKFLQTPDFFQMARDVAVARLGEAKAALLKSGAVTGGTPVPDPVAEWAGNLTSQLDPVTFPLQMTASTEYAGDASKPAFDRAMAAGQTVLFLNLATGGAAFAQRAAQQGLASATVDALAGAATESGAKLAETADKLYGRLWRSDPVKAVAQASGLPEQVVSDSAKAHEQALNVEWRKPKPQEPPSPGAPTSVAEPPRSPVETTPVSPTPSEPSSPAKPVGTPSGAKEPWQMTRDEFVGNPRLYSGKTNVKETPKRVYAGTSEAAPEPFLGGKYQLRRGQSQVAVYDGDKVIATYTGGDNLVVDPKYRRQGIATELLSYYKKNIDPTQTAASRSKEVQGIYLKVHKSQVEQALKEGKPVPQEVLKDYPDLVAKYPQTTAPTPETPNANIENGPAGPTTGVLRQGQPEVGLPQTGSGAEAGGVAATETPTAQTPPQGRTVADVKTELSDALKRIATRQRPLGAGLGSFTAEDLKDIATVGARLFELGYRTFDDWAREMMARVGRHVQPQLRHLWDQVSSAPPDDAVKRLQDAIEAARPVRASEAAQIAKEVHSRQAGALSGIQAQGGSLPEQLGRLKGGYANYAFELPSGFAPADAAHLTEMVNNNERLTPFQKVNALQALEKLTGGGDMAHTLPDGTTVHFGALPTKSELDLLSRVFGRGVVGAVKAKAATPSFLRRIVDEVFLFRKGALLGNPRTITRNFLGNAVEAAAKEGFRWMEAPIDMLASMKTGMRLRSAWVPPSWSATKMVVDKTLVDMRDALLHGPTGIQGSGTDFLEPRFGPTKGALRFQNIQDVPWQNMAYERSLREQARLMAKGDKDLFDHLVLHPTDAMTVAAKVDAQMATFAVDSKMADFLNKAGKVPVFGRFVDILLPFKRIPSNLGGDLATSNPLGIAYNVVKFMQAVNAEYPNEAARVAAIIKAQKTLTRSVRNGSLGTFLLAYGRELYKQGVLIPASSASKPERDTGAALGEPPASLIVNGRAKQLSGMHPLINVMVLGATMQRDFEDNMRKLAEGDTTGYESKMLRPEWFQYGPSAGADARAGVDAVLNGVNQTMQQFPFFQGVKQLSDIFRNESSVSDYAYQVAGTWAPTLGDTFARMFQPGYNELRRPATATEAFLSRLGLPSGALRMDAFGRVRTASGPFDVFNTQVVRKTPVEDFMRKHGLTVSELSKLPHESDPNNPDRFAQYAARQAIVGQVLYKYLEANLDMLKKVPSKQLPGMWRSLVQDGRDIGDVAFSKAAQSRAATGSPMPQARGTRLAPGYSTPTSPQASRG